MDGMASAIGLCAVVFWVALGGALSCSTSDGDCSPTCMGGSSSSGTTQETQGGSSAATAGGDTDSSVSGSMGVAVSPGVGGTGGDDSCEQEVSDDVPCWMTNDHGVFVSSEYGDDETADGTRELPYKTLGKGIASSKGKNVYVCVGSGDYMESVALDHPSTEVRIYGGFECENWSYDTRRYTRVFSPSHIALRLNAIDVGVYIENIEFVAADGSGEDASSYAAFVTNSDNVRLKRVKLGGGKGLAGGDGKDGDRGLDGKDPEPLNESANALCPSDGEVIEDGHGGVPVPGTCGSQGGQGGDGLVDNRGIRGRTGSPLTNVTPADFINGGEEAIGWEEGGRGMDGSPGDNGELGQAAGEGTWSVLGFSPASGNNGKPGFPGQGGGGGGPSRGGSGCRGASGGVGGMGGCGGGHGEGGAGGGASVGLFSWQSAVTLVGCDVRAADGGKGGNGGRGGIWGAGAGGTGGGLGTSDDDAHIFAPGGWGGRGGNGGFGGSGSGGSGGPSYAIVFAGDRPSSDAATNLHFRSGGEGGEGGLVPLAGAAAPSGTNGAAGAEYEASIDGSH